VSGMAALAMLRRAVEPIHGAELDLLKKTLDGAMGFHPRPKIGVAFTEPLIHVQILDFCREIVSRGFFCSITSNGFLLPQKAEALVEIGVDEITISIDGAPEVHDRIRGRKGSFARLYEGIEKLNAARARLGRTTPRVRISSTINDLNYDQLRACLDAVAPLQPDSVNFAHLSFITDSMAAAHNARYDGELRGRIAAIASDVASASSAPAYVYDLKALKPLPPVRPALILNAAANYEEHAQGIAQQQQRAGAAPQAPASAAATAPGLWERKAGDTRDNPYLFLKSPTVIIGNNDSIVMPRGRTQIDFECEFAAVIGKTAKAVPIASAADYIFGYTAHHDVSDRAGRGDRKMGGSDWLVGKNHDTFGPLGPYIVPKEFMKDPMNTRHTMYLNNMVMQDSNTNRMSHNMYELLHFATNNLTLRVGDVISGGSPAGTNIERADPRWMRAGDTAKCEIEGIGALVNPVVAEPTTATR